MDTTTETKFRAVRLTARAFKRLDAVDLVIPHDGLTLAGRNAQGKSSVLDSIAAAIGGAAAQPERPIRDGADAAGIRLILEAQDGGEPARIVVTRSYKLGDDGERWTSSLRVAYDDDHVERRGQTALDALRGAAVDPHAWAEVPGLSKPEARDRARLRMMAGGLAGEWDLDAHARRREVAAERRLVAGREARAAEAHADALGAPPAESPAPDDAEVRRLRDAVASARALRAEWSLRVRGRADAGAEAGRKVDRAETAVTDSQSKVDRLRAQLEEAIGVATVARTVRDAALQSRSQVLDTIDKEAAADPEPVAAADATALESAELAHAQAVEQHRESRAEIARVQAARADAEAKRARWSEAESAVAALDEELARRVAAIPLPDGVSITPELRVLVRGVPVDQASAAERLRASVAVAAGLCGRLRLLWVHDGALLDSGSRALMAQAAAEAGVQLVVETVEPTDGAVVIEDGRLAARED